MVTFEQIPGTLNVVGVVGNDLTIDILFKGTDLTGYTFSAYVVLEPDPLEKTYALTVTNTSLADGLVKASITEAQTTEIGPVSNKPWYFQWIHSGLQENVLFGRFQLNRF